MLQWTSPFMTPNKFMKVVKFLTMQSTKSCCFIYELKWKMWKFCLLMLFNCIFNVVKIIFLNEWNLHWNEGLYRKIIQNFIRFYKNLNCTEFSIQHMTLMCFKRTGYNWNRKWKCESASPNHYFTNDSQHRPVRSVKNVGAKMYSTEWWFRPKVTNWRSFPHSADR